MIKDNLRNIEYILARNTKSKSDEFAEALNYCDCIRKELEQNTDEWRDIKNELPMCNILVKVLLTNGVEELDFVNAPVNNDMPFQHYHVKAWRYATREELNAFMQKANRK